MDDKIVILSELNFYDELRLGYVGEESWLGSDYYWENADRAGEHAVIQLTQAGECFFEQDDRRQIVAAGDAFITEVPSATTYGFPEGNTEPYRPIFLAMHGDRAMHLARGYRLKYGPLVSLARRAESYSLFREIYQRYSSHALRDRIEESTLLYQLFGALYREAELDAVRGDAVAACYQRIQTRYRESANINEIARDGGVSREHLTRSFKQRYGQTPANMLRDLRVREARMLIESDIADFESIARTVGFDDVRTLKRYL